MPIFLRPAGQFTTTSYAPGTLARFLMSDDSLDGTAFINNPLMQARGTDQGTETGACGKL
jgi:hypothetical protein